MALHTIDNSTDEIALPPTLSLLTRLQRFPALMALCIQLGAATIIGLSLVGMTFVLKLLFDTSLSVPLALVFVFQALVSSALAHHFKMAPWWKWIHLCFPVMVWLMLMFTIPTEAYLVAFLLTAGVYWSSYKTQVPYYPSSLSIWQKVSAVTHQYQAQYGSDIRVMEIGSGLGGFAMYIAKTHPEARVEGVEVAPLPWLYSVIRRHFSRSSARFKLSNYQQLNFGDYDIVFAYLSPAVMPALWDKAKQEQSSKQLLISLEFPVPGVKPTQHIPGDDHSPALYIYQR